MTYYSHKKAIGIFFLICFSLFTFQKEASSNRLNTLNIKDGDSFTLNGTEIRIWGIDAPEYKQQCTRNGEKYACGLESKKFLTSMLKPETDIKCIQKSKSRRETRQVSQCYISYDNQDSVDLGQIMIKNGHAIDYTYFSKGYYKPVENTAKEKNLGIWSGEFISPREWRKTHKIKYQHGR